MSAIVLWFFGAWVSAFCGVALGIIGFDCWLNHRRDVMKQSRGEVR